MLYAVEVTILNICMLAISYNVTEGVAGDK